MQATSTLAAACNEEPPSLQQSTKPPLPSKAAAKSSLPSAPAVAKKKQLFHAPLKSQSANKAGAGASLARPSIADSKAAPSSSASFEPSPKGELQTGTVTPVSRRLTSVSEDSLISSAQPGRGKAIADLGGPSDSGQEKNLLDASSIEEDKR